MTHNQPKSQCNAEAKCITCGSPTGHKSVPYCSRCYDKMNAEAKCITCGSPTGHKLILHCLKCKS
jgi:DNA-directed RNA polymerase subunit N (RpoN/RPB10)